MKEEPRLLFTVISFLHQGRGVWRDVLHERADLCERAYTDPAGTSVSKL